MRTAEKHIVDRVAHLERSVLGCLGEFCSRGSAKELDVLIASPLTADRFTASDNRAIFQAMLDLRDEGKIPDDSSLIDKLDIRTMAQVWDFSKGVVSENLECYVRDLREAWQDCRFAKQTEELANLTKREEQLALLERMRETLLSKRDAGNWRSIFHTPKKSKTRRLCALRLTASSKRRV